MEERDLEGALRRLLELLGSQPEKALEEAEALLKLTSRRVAQLALRFTGLERQRLFELAFNLESSARSMKAARARLRAARTEEDVRLALLDARMDLEESLSYAVQVRSLLNKAVPSDSL